MKQPIAINVPESNPAGPALSQDPFLRRLLKVALDALVTGFAFILASSVWLHGLQLDRGLAVFALLAMVINLAFRFPSQHYRVVDIEEARSLLIGTTTLAAIAMTLSLLGPGWSPNFEPEIALTGSLLTGFSWLAIRLSALTLHQLHQRHQASPAARGEQALFERTLIVGAGVAGALLCKALREHPRLQCNVLGFIDDALEKQGLRIHGVPVLGHSLLLPTIIREQQATQVILAMPGVHGARLKELSEVVRAQGVCLKTVPGILDLVGERPWKPEVRDISIEDLLRREPITLDRDAAWEALHDKVVLITGAGGSIGSELTRRVADLRPRTLVLLGRGENSLWELQRQMAEHFPNQAVAIALCDIRNPSRLHDVFTTWNPAVVFHAAAHKHVHYLEANPEEAIENNIFGTLNVLEAAIQAGTGIFVNISTDKAVNPVNMLGASKAFGELLVAQAAHEIPRAKFVSVRFGNVLGSRGSVIPIFREQIRAGGPVTVTHPDMVRYFMTIPEAAQLVIQAGILGDSGKVFALDMGDPVHIVTLAEEMVRLSGFTPGVDMDIAFTGVRPGEKLVEELFSGRQQRAEVHPKIFEVEKRLIDPHLLEAGLAKLGRLRVQEGENRYPDIVRCFMEVVPNYQPTAHGLGRFLEAVGTPSRGQQKTVAAPMASIFSTVLGPERFAADPLAILSTVPP